MTHIDELVKRARGVADHAFSGAPRFVGELADALESQSAELTRLRDRNAELEKVIAWANNSLFGSHSFFLSINGGEDNEHHLDEGIENLKQQNRDYWSRIAELERNIKHKTELGAVLSAAHLQNRARIAELDKERDEYKLASVFNEAQLARATARIASLEATVRELREARISDLEGLLRLLDETRNVPNKRTWDGHFASCVEAKLRDLRSPSESVVGKSEGEQDGYYP